MISFIVPYTLRYGDYLSPFVESINAFERVEIIPVDTGVDDNYGYTRALNFGAELAHGEWLIFCNDDIICSGKFQEKIQALNPNFLYGLEIRQKDESWGLKFQYLYGWLLLMHRSIWDTVGGFEEYYAQAGFDDIDYSWRTQDLGFALQKIKLPFLHVADTPGQKHRRSQVHGFQEQMARSKTYFLEKVHAQDISIPKPSG